jgi:hypothetical protein
MVVLDADDVVLAEIAAGLHLDQLQHDLARVFQPVDGADRDIDRFVLVHDLKALCEYPRSDVERADAPASLRNKAMNPRAARTAAISIPVSPPCTLGAKGAD